MHNGTLRWAEVVVVFAVLRPLPLWPQDDLGPAALPASSSERLEAETMRTPGPGWFDFPTPSVPQEVVPATAVAPERSLQEKREVGLRLGCLDVYPRASAAAFYDDNIFVSSVVKESDLIWSFAPAVGMSLGNTREPWEKSFALDYSPNLLVFTDHSRFSAIDHAIRLTGAWPLTKLTLAILQEFALASTAVLGTTDRFEHRSYNTHLISRYAISEKASVENTARQGITEFEQARFINSSEWADDSWINYNVTAKTSVGGGFTVGYLQTENNPNQLYQRVSARLLYTFTAKADLTVSVGGERRDYAGTDSTGIYPVFAVGASYRPRATTTVALTGSRAEQNSAYLPDENYQATGVSIAVQQLINDRFVVSISGAYNSLEYHSTRWNLATTRSDELFLIRAGSDWVIRRSWRAGVWYAFRQYSSSEKFYNYDNNQMGLQMSWSF